MIESYNILHNRIVSTAVDTCTTSRKLLRILQSADESTDRDMAEIRLGQIENETESTQTGFNRKFRR